MIVTLNNAYRKDTEFALIDGEKPIDTLTIKNTLVPGDKVFFYDSIYPALQLSKVPNVNIKRCTSIDKATKIIMDYCTFIAREGVVREDEYQQWRRCYGKIPTNEEVEGFIIYGDRKKYEFIKEHKDKIIWTYSLTLYLNQFLPIPTEAEKLNIKTLVNSKEYYAMGIELMQYFNWENDLYFLCRYVLDNRQRLKDYKFHSSDKYKLILLKIGSCVKDVMDNEFTVLDRCLSTSVFDANDKLNFINAVANIMEKEVRYMRFFKENGITIKYYNDNDNFRTFNTPSA